MLLSNKFYVNAADIRYVQQDNDKNLINLFNLEKNNDQKYDFINLRSASYFIGKNYLNVTLWIKSFNSLTSMNSLNGSIIYGILINSDPYSNTGIDGVDYDLQLKLDSNKKSAMRELKEISIEGETKTITFHKENYTKLIQNEKKYINLNLALRDLHSPSVFSVLFYAIFEPINAEDKDSCKQDSCKLLDYLKWINIPPPKVIISTAPDSINLRQESDELLTIFANSQSTSDTNIRFFFERPPQDLVIKFNNSTKSSEINLFLPSQQNNFVEATIKANQLTVPRKVNLKLNSEISIPDKEISYFSILYGNNTGVNKKENVLDVRNTVLKLPLILVPLDIKEYDALQTTLDKYSKVFQTLSVIFGAIGAILTIILSYVKRPWVIKKFKNLKNKTNRTIKKSSND
jgi:hypothetical protein